MTKLNQKQVTIDAAAKLSLQARTKGRKVGFTSGVFDILHLGHVEFLQSIKKRVDFLIVGVDDNKTASLIKGDDRPYFDETERAALLAALECVDCVFIFQGPCNSQLLARIKPNYYGVAPFDPSIDLKRKDAKVAKVRVLITPHNLKTQASSKIGRMIWFEYLMSKSPNRHKEARGWKSEANRD